MKIETRQLLQTEAKILAKQYEDLFIAYINAFFEQTDVLEL